MPLIELRKPRLPPRVKAEVTAYAGPRHPFLAQGMLAGLWPGTGDAETFTKNAEINKQLDNLGGYFHLPANDAASVTAILVAIAQRQADVAALPGTTVRSLNANVTSHLLVGTGLPNQLETGLLLHPLYGVPYIPGSAIKGVTQATLLAGWAAEAGIDRLPFERHQQVVHHGRGDITPLLAFERLLFASAVSDDIWSQGVTEAGAALQAWGVPPPHQTLAAWAAGDGRAKGRLFVGLFGAPALTYRDTAGERHPHQGSRSLVTFLDAFPTHLHVGRAGQTPHGGKYYEAARKLFLPDQGAPPAPPAPDDHFDPVPVQFIAVGAGSIFRVTVAARDADLARAAATAVGSALSLDGLGAKRGIGFGRFQVTNVNQPAPAP